MSQAEGDAITAMNTLLEKRYDRGNAPSFSGLSGDALITQIREERRKELNKDVKKKAEASKVAIRNIRRDALDAFKKQEKKKEITKKK